MFRYLTLLLTLSSLNAFATQRVVVLDTGLNLTDPRFTPYLCKDGHKDFTGHGIEDSLGHGTHIVGNIIHYAKDADYCLIIVKFYHDFRSDDSIYSNAFQYATSLNPSIINFSGGGGDFKEWEYLSIQMLSGITWMVAAGNNHTNLDENCNFFPACYQINNVISVGNLNKNLTIAKASNYGKHVKQWEIGDKVYSTLPCLSFETKDKCNGYMSGTSMATSTATGKLIYQRFKDGIK